MQALAQAGFSTEQVKTALHSGRHLGFRYELLDSQNRHKADLVGVDAGSVRNDALAEIKRTARFRVIDGVDAINYLSDRIKPFVRLKVSSTWLEWPQGVFLLSSPTREVQEDGSILRDIEAYDQLIVLRDDRIIDRYTVAAGVNYISGANGLRALLEGAGIVAHNLTATAKVTPAAMDWAPGTSKLRIANDLLAALNYRSLFFDENGVAIATPYVAPSNAPVEYSYVDDSDSVLYREMTEELDLYEVANRWVLVVSEPDRPALSSTYTNASASSPTSTVTRGRTITDFREGVNAADQATLDALVSRLAFEASQVYHAVTLETGIMPHHSDSDVIKLVSADLQISALFSEPSWEMPLRIGAKMRHRLRKVVTV